MFHVAVSSTPGWWRKYLQSPQNDESASNREAASPPAMEVHASETAVVFPSRPPFEHDHVLPLSHLDTDRNLHVTFRYVRTYTGAAASDRPSDPFSVISAALSDALVHYYPFTGSLRRRRSDGRLELLCSAGKGVPFVRAAADCSLESVNYLDEPDRHFVEQLVPDPAPDEGLAAPFVLQLTVFACGGYCLGASIHHAMCDGLGATQFFNAVAELARGASRISVEPVWERSGLLGPREPPRVEFPFEEVLVLEKGSLPYGESGEAVVRECFHVKDGCLDRYKALLLEKSGVGFTTFEALGAFLWRARVRATGVKGHEKVKFAYSINIRKLVKPALPAGYWGNGCVPMYVQLTGKEVVENPIWETAKLIKKSKSKAGEEYVRSFIDFQEVNYGKGITAGKGVSGFTDWRHLGHSTVDFGWGGPVTVLPLSRRLLGSVEPCFFLPYSSDSAGNKDGFKVLITLPETALHVFRQEMQNFTSENFGFF